MHNANDTTEKREHTNAIGTVAKSYSKYKMQTNEMSK